MGDISDVFDGHEFDGQGVDAPSYDPLPAGDYQVMVSAAEVKENSKKTGKYLKLELEVLTEGFTGRKVFSNINLTNPNKTAEEIGLRDLEALRVATGLKAIGDSADLVDKVIVVRLAVKNSEQYGPQNEVKGYKPSNGMRSPAQASTTDSPVSDSQQSQEPAPQQAPSDGKRPWEK